LTVADADAIAVRIVEIDGVGRAGRAALGRFYREAYVAQFPDRNEREPLAQVARYLKLKMAGWYGANNYHVLVALQGPQNTPVGGAVFDYLAKPRAGIVEFLFVLPQVRHGGLGRRLLDAGQALLETDAHAQGVRLQALVAEMNDPYRHPVSPDSMDPFVRARVWGSWGFQRLCCPYAQPALSPGQAVVDYLTLIVKPLRGARASVAAAWMREVVAEYMRWAMRIDKPQANREYRALDAHLGQRARVALLPLGASIGDHPAFDVHDLAPDQPAFAAVVRLAARAIPERGRVASPEQFRAAWQAARMGGPAYHLWRVAAPGVRDVQGMASFFGLAECGFGGYIVLDDALRGRGLLVPLVARIEARLVTDRVRKPGWFIECADASARVFRRVGFADLPLRWCPPTVGTTASAAEPLHLLYKPFGPVDTPPRLSARFVRRALRAILQGVYGIEAPLRSATYRLANASLSVNAAGDVILIRARAALSRRA
jgi:GNAT superfamily N-acetyltransferase